MLVYFYAELSCEELFAIQFCKKMGHHRIFLKKFLTNDSLFFFFHGKKIKQKNIYDKENCSCG